MAKAKPIDPQVKEERQRIADFIVKATKQQDEIFTPEGVHTLPCKDKNNAYKNKPIGVGVEHMLSSAYVGARGQIILCFEPVDAREYLHFEVEEKKVDLVFPTLTGLVADLIGAELVESFDVLIEAVKLFLSRQDAKAQEEKEAAKLEADKGYVEHPMFGRF